jgi:16S rRNA (guanine527-N7)-methyltransferase
MVPRRRGPRQAAGDRVGSFPSFRAALDEEAAALGRPLRSSEAAAMETHYRLLRRWGRTMNLTGLRGERDILRRHFLEPIAVAGLLGNRGVLVDIGSGNGFPAIPLKVLHPGLDLVMVEGSERKSAFLWAVVREIGLCGARVETRRVGSRRDLRDLLPCRHLTLRGVKVREILRGDGPLLEPEGLALFFLAPAEAEALRRDPVPGLQLSETRPLPTGPGSVVALLRPARSLSRS